MIFVHCILVVFFFAVGEAQINWICDAENGYALKGLLYTGRNGEERQIDQASTKAGQLAQPFVDSNRNVFMDRYFTSYSTVKHLLEHGLTAIDKVFAHRCDVLACNDDQLRAKEKQQCSSMSKANLLISCHAKVKVDNQQDFKRPNIIGQNNGLYFIVEIEMLGGITLHGKDAAVMLPKAQEALFLLDTKQKFGVFRKLVVAQHSQMFGGTTEYTDSDAHIKEQVKQAIFETDRKKTNGTYLWLEKIVNGYNMGISSHFQVLLKQTVCPIKVKRYNSYKKVYENCRGYGDLKNCTVEYKYFDPTISTVEC
ncbi:hypothetical protein T08_12717 [Trichinella sp. T8]|nr:hypothetical protein T08_12717 [Trichinella sp. T8]